MRSLSMVDVKLWSNASAEEKVAMVLADRIRDGDFYFDERKWKWLIWLRGEFIEVSSTVPSQSDVKIV